MPTGYAINYEKDGWSRKISEPDLKLQWCLRGVDVDMFTRFDPLWSAFVRKLIFTDEDSRMRAGSVSLVPLQDGVVDSSLNEKDDNGVNVSFAEIAMAQKMTFSEKVDWFRGKENQLRVEWNEGHMRMNVRRGYLLSDSMEAVMSLGAKELRMVWRFEFIDEPGIDNGQLAQEWFELVSEQMFDPNLGLWQPTLSDPSRLQINPASEICCPDDHLDYFRFVGRILGKALFDGHHIKGLMAKYLYKHLLGWPVMFIDLKDLDEEYYYSLKGLIDMGEDVEFVGADFTVTENVLGAKHTVELVEDGSNVDVTARNVLEYVEACLKYRLLGQCEMQVNELLLGFFDVVPEPLLGIFDYQELELLMSGVA